MILRVGKLFFIGALAVLFSRAAYSQATMGSLDQNADQSQGQYMPMNLGYAGFNSLGMTQAAWLDPLQNLGEGQSKPAYSKYYWSPDLILPIRLREGMITLLNFPQWELIEDMYIGDNATFDGQISGPNTILLYPRKGANVGVDTNIIIFGRSGNKYVFYVRSEGVNTERLTNSIIDIDVIDGPAGSRGAGMVGGSVGGGSGMNASSYKAGNSHSADSLFTKRFQRSDWIKEIPLDPTKFRFDIEVYVPNPDDVVIAPERVWRDDIFTYIDLGEKALNMTQRPIVTLIVERIEVPVGFRTKGPNNRLIIVEGIGDMVLRNGKRIVCLKMRRSDDAGLENATYATDFDDSAWDVPPAMPGQQARNGQVSGGSGSYTWISEDDGIASVDSTGKVTAISKGTINIVVTDGSKKGVCIVRCNVSGTAAPAAPTTPSTTTNTGSSTSGSLKTGSGVVTNAAGGVNVRPSAGTDGSPIASLKNGDKVQIVSSAGNGWYQITFSGPGGADVTGYMKGDYLTNS